MAVLSAGDRRATWAEFMSTLSSRREGISLNKNDLRAAVDSVDQWVNANTAGFNSALPSAARTNLTPSQKAELLVAVVTKRFKVGA